MSDFKRLIKRAVGTMPPPASFSPAVPVHPNPAIEAARQRTRDAVDISNYSPNARMVKMMDPIYNAGAKATNWIQQKADVNVGDQYRKAPGMQKLDTVIGNWTPSWMPRPSSVAAFPSQVIRGVAGGANESMHRFTNAGNAVADGNLGTAATEFGQGTLLLGNAALTATGLGGLAKGVAGAALARTAPGLLKGVQSTLARIPSPVSKIPGVATLNKIPGSNSSLVQTVAPQVTTRLEDNKGTNPDFNKAHATVAQATGKDGADVADAASRAGFSGADFEQMMPFLMAIMPMLFGGQQANISNPNYVPSSLDRLGARSQFG